jgi:hypothetical protein
VESSVDVKTDWRRLALAVSVAGFGVDTAWALSTFAATKPFLPLWPLILLFVGIFPVHLRTVMGLIRHSGGGSGRFTRGRLLSSYKRMPRAWRVLASVLFGGLWAIAVTALWSLRNGGPDVVNGQFFANNHGSLTPISRAAFHHLQLAEQRLFSAVPAAFYLVGALYNGTTRRTGAPGEISGAEDQAQR